MLGGALLAADLSLALADDLSDEALQARPIPEAGLSIPEAGSFSPEAGLEGACHVRAAAGAPPLPRAPGPGPRAGA